MKGNVSVICINMKQGESNPSHLQSCLWSAEGNVRICGWYERSRDGPTRRVATTDALLTCSPKTHPHHLSNRTTHDALLHSALKRCARGLECTQHSVHSKS